MAEGGSKGEVSPKVVSENSGRWDFLKKPAQAVFRRIGLVSDTPDNYVDNPPRRKLLKGALIAGIATVIGGRGILKAAEGSLQGEDETFKVGNEEVQVSWKEFTPKKVKDSSEVVLVLPGMPGRAKAPALWTLPKQLAEGFEAKSIMIDGRSKGNFAGNSIDLEVEGIRQFLLKNNIKKVSIVGHSVGSVKAVKLAVSLQESNPDIEIRGVALANPVGLYEQSAKELVGNVKTEFPNMARLSNPNTPQTDKDPLKAGWQILGSFSSEMSTTGFGYPKLVSEQVQALTKLNPKLSEVKVPVVVMVGKEDNIAQVNRIFPEHEMNARLSGNLPQNKREQMAVVGRARKQYLKESVLPQAENIEVIEASKFASHAAFGERPAQTGRVLSKLFDRLKRPNTGVRAV